MFGTHLKLDVRGASHSPAISFSLKNFPAGFLIDMNALEAFMERRAPGRDKFSTSRRENDTITFTQGVTGDITTGEPINGHIKNTDIRPTDYGAARTIPRPGHADFGQWVTEGRIPTGGGKNSGRLTVALCAAGGFCKQWLKARGIDVHAEVSEIGGRTDLKGQVAILEKVHKKGDSVGGSVHCTITCPPVGLGGALFDGLESALSAALFAIPGVKGVAFGTSALYGSTYNDAFRISHGEVITTSNRQGGLMGGRTNGMPITFDVSLRPTPTVFIEQASVDLMTMKAAKLKMKGRHDPCIVRRAVPVVEAVAAFVLMDALLADEAAHPRICLTLTGQTLEEDLAQYQAERYFTDMVELRVDLLNAKNRARVAHFPEMLRTCGHTPRHVPVILTYRRKRDGGAFVGSEKMRVAFFKKALKSGFFAYVDFEEGFGDASLVTYAHEAGAKVIRSLHDFTGPVKNLSARVKKLCAAGDIAKVAFLPRTLADVSKLFHQKNKNCLLLAMGPQGLATRVLAGRLGAPWTYASVEGLAELGHITPHELVRDYRFRTATRHATLFGVTGWPLKKTRSPELHNAAFAAEDEDALMIPFPAKTAREALRFMRAMNMRGLAVTIPHKQSVISLLDGVEESAFRIGAVNTLLRIGNELIGFNTDVEGFLAAITSFVGNLKGCKVAVLGDGGAAQAVKAALTKLGATYRVFHRTTPPQGFTLIVNTTPVDPIPDYVFTGREHVFDLSYVPEVTPLMERAARAGCKVENGFKMLVRQAEYQRSLWI